MKEKWQDPAYRLMMVEKLRIANGKRRGEKRPPRSAEHIRNLSLGHLGQKAWNKGTGHPYIPTGRRTWTLSAQSKENVRNAVLARPKESWDWMRKRRGALHHNWKGGQKRYKHTTTTTEYKEWRGKVFNRDNYTCKHCGVGGGVYLEAHHIKSWALFPEQRFEVDNGLTLCKPCHAKTDNYKGRSNKSYV